MEVTGKSLSKPEIPVPAVEAHVVAQFRALETFLHHVQLDDRHGLGAEVLGESLGLRGLRDVEGLFCGFVDGFGEVISFFDLQGF